MSWEFVNEKDMYAQLVGDFYGPTPEAIKQEISESRQKIAISILKNLDVQPEHKIMDLGSGMGDMALAVASKVNHLYCVDISQSFLSVARDRCKFLRNVSFHHLASFNFDFLENGTLDAIYSHAVFIHLNVYDIILYFKSFKKVLKEGGKVYIDFTTSDTVDFMSAQNLKDHVQFYERDKNSLPHLLSFHSRQSIVKIAKSFGLHVQTIIVGPNHNIRMVFRKGQRAFLRDKLNSLTSFLLSSAYNKFIAKG